jgi:hypothetical protein
VTKSETSPPSENGVPPEPNNGVALRRTLVWAGIAGASAVLTFFIVRATMRRTPVDETSERIQLLIGEANRLLRTLDEKRKDG